MITPSHTQLVLVYCSLVLNDLGITVQSNLKHGLHCTQLATKANLRTKLILKSFLSHDEHSLTRAFTTFVRPILEYATPVWCPHFKCDIDLIEEGQCTFTRKLYLLCNLMPVSYNNKLSFLGLQCLELRRILNDLCFMFKLTHGMISCQLQHAIHYAPHTGTRGHLYKPYVAPVKKLVLSTNFMYRAVPIWNSLPRQCFVPDTFNAFRAKIRNIDFNDL